MVGGDNDFIIALRQELEEFGQHRVVKPALSNAAIGRLVVG